MGGDAGRVRVKAGSGEGVTSQGEVGGSVTSLAEGVGGDAGRVRVRAGSVEGVTSQGEVGGSVTSLAEGGGDDAGWELAGWITGRRGIPGDDVGWGVAGWIMGRPGCGRRRISVRMSAVCAFAAGWIIVGVIYPGDDDANDDDENDDDFPHGGYEELVVGSAAGWIMSESELECGFDEYDDDDEE